MNVVDCPIKTDELRRQLHLPAEVFEEQLELCLMTAVEWVEDYAGVNLLSFEQLPYQLRSAVLLYAAHLFENPVDSVCERMTAAMRLADPLKWQTKNTTSESSQNA